MLQSSIQNYILMGRTKKPVNKKRQAQTLAQDKILVMVIHNQNWLEARIPKPDCTLKIMVLPKNFELGLPLPGKTLTIPRSLNLHEKKWSGKLDGPQDGHSLQFNGVLQMTLGWPGTRTNPGTGAVIDTRQGCSFQRPVPGKFSNQGKLLDQE